MKLDTIVGIMASKIQGIRLGYFHHRNTAFKRALQDMIDWIIDGWAMKRERLVSHHVCRMLSITAGVPLFARQQLLAAVLNDCCAICPPFIQIIKTQHIW